MSSFRKIFLIILFLSAVSLFHCTSQNSFTFVFMTDIHMQRELGAPAGLTAAIDQVNELQADFVITGGDLIMDALGQPFEKADALYNLYDSLTQHFAMPVHNTIGNHEVFGLYEESGVSPQHADFGKNLFLKKMGYERTYYSFDHKGWHFIVLDGIGFTPERRYYGFIDSTQIAWLESDLSALAKTTPIVVSTHIPFVSVYGQFTEGSTFGMSQGEVIVNAHDVLARFAGHNLKLVLQGHLHEIEDIHFRGAHFITGGAVCGAWWQGARDGFPEGFVVVKVKDNDFTWSYQTYGWQAEQYATGE